MLDDSKRSFCNAFYLYNIILNFIIFFFFLKRVIGFLENDRNKAKLKT